MKSLSLILNELLVHGNKKKDGYSFFISFREGLWIFEKEQKTPETDKKVKEITKSLTDAYQEDGLSVETIYENSNDIDQFFQVLNDELDTEGNLGIIVGGIYWDKKSLYVDIPRDTELRTNIQIRKIMDTLGLKSVGSYNLDYKKKQVTGDIPDVLYHGTIFSNFLSIYKNGLAPGHDSMYQHVTQQYSEHVFLTSKFMEAWYHAQHSQGETSRKKKRDSIPMVLEFRNIDKNKLVADFDSIRGLSRSDKEDLGIDSDYDISGYEYEEWAAERSKYHTGANRKSKIMGVWGYRGTILPQKIKYVYLPKDIYSGKENYIESQSEVKKYTVKQALRIYEYI